MARILHLSDLHLSDVELDASIGDYSKTDCLPKEERLTLRKSLRWTINAWVDSIKDQGKLDAVVVSGDITVANRDDGWENFEEFLNQFSAVLPDRDRIVVVPGNHDVARDQSKRYENFCKYIRDQGFITPLLEGVDHFDETSYPDLKRHLVVDKNQSWAIIPINSSYFCGIKEPIAPIPEPELEKFLLGLGADEKGARERIARLRMQDMARISWPQICVMRFLCEEAKKIAESDRPTLIGVLHHQLLPVDANEEVKPYDALTNLGLFREVLAKNGFNVVLHGHKHVGRIFIDHVSSMDHAADIPPHRLAIVSSPSIASARTAGQPFFRELEIAGASGSPTLFVQDVTQAYGGTGSVPVKRSPVYAWSTSSNAHLRRCDGRFIEGDSLDEVYEKALSVFRDKASDEELQNLSCRVATGTETPTLPMSYPSDEVKEIAGGDNWLARIIDWWQKAGFTKLALNGVFNHGTRLYGDGRNSLNQIENVIETLAKAPHSSRAVATLVDPHRDKVDDQSINFPSFCFVQFLLTKFEHEYFLDVVAYFRKQEIKFWWPVNYAELSLLQGIIVEKLRSRDIGLSSINRGTITTIAARAKFGSHVPNIMVPEADMALEKLGHAFWDMTYALCQPRMDNREQILANWDEVCAAFIPVEKPSLKEFVAPIQCLTELIRVAQPFMRFHENIRQLSAEWELIHNENSEINMRRGGVTATDYSIWRTRVSEAVERVTKLVAEARAATSTSS